MLIQLDRTGGFAGISRKASFSTDSMPADEQQKLTALVNSCRFFETPSTVRSANPGADQFQYKISVQSEQGTHSVQFPETAVPAQLAPLFEWLKSATSK